MRKIQFSLTVLSALFLMSATIMAQQTPPVAQLTLKSAVDLAVRNSRDMTMARLNAQLADGATAVDRAAFLPNLGTGSGYVYSSGFPLSPGGGVPTLFDLAYSQSIYNPLAKGQFHADQERSKALTASIASVRDAVMAHTATTYLELTKVRQSLEVLRKQRQDLQKISDYVRDRVAAGYELPIEQTKAELNAMRIEQRIAHEDGRDEALADQLRDMLGLEQDQPLDLINEDLPPAADEPVADLVAKALATNGDLKQAEAEKLAKEDILKGTRASRWPTIQAIGNYSVLSNTNNFSKYFNNFSRNNVNVGVSASIPILNPHTTAAMGMAQADASTADVAVRAKRSEVELQVRAQSRMAHELEIGRDVARLDMKLAQQNMALVQAQFDQGRASLRDLEQAQLDENDKLLAFLEANFQRQQAELALLQYTGQVNHVLQ